MRTLYSDRELAIARGDVRIKISTTVWVRIIWVLHFRAHLGVSK